MCKWSTISLLLIKNHKNNQYKLKKNIYSISNLLTKQELSTDNNIIHEKFKKICR